MSVQLTTKISLGIQAAVGALQLQSIFVKLEPENRVLMELMYLEAGVQAIELCFYIWFIKHFNLDKLAATRYRDWFVTTPVMLFNVMVYMKYLERKQSNQSTTFHVIDFWNENKSEVSTMFISNFMMLSLGYLGEIGVIPRLQAAIMSFAFFAVTFFIIYKFAKFSAEGKRLYSILIGIWSLYGFAFLFPKIAQNNIFNTLDLFSKNFFSLFLWKQINNLRI